METVTNNSSSITWDDQERVALVRYKPGATLGVEDGNFLASTLAKWVGDDDAPFGVVADAKDLRATTGEYRAVASSFFRKHRTRAAIAMLNLGSYIAIVVELFRIGTGIRLKAFSDERAARVWLREQARVAG